MSHAVENRKNCSFSFDTLKRLAGSTLGRLGISAIAEVAFGLIGRFYSRKVCSDLIPLAGKGILTVARKGWIVGVPAALILAARKVEKTGLFILAGVTVGVAAAWALCSEEQIHVWGDTLRETVLSIVELAGENLGGFIGLELTGWLFGQGGIVYWDRNNQSDCYLVSMARFQGAALLYNSIVNPTIFLLKIPCAIGGAIFKMAAFNMNLLIPFFEKTILCLKKNQLSGNILQPFLAQNLSRRFLNTQPISLQQSKIYSIFLESLKTTIQQVIAMTSLKKWNDLEFEDLIVRLAGQTFKSYTALIKLSERIASAQKKFNDSPKDVEKLQELDEAIRLEIQAGPSLSQTIRNKLVNWYLDPKTLETAGSAIVKEIINMEIDLTGSCLMSRGREEILKGSIPIYLKYFLNYAVLHLEKFTNSDLEPCEEISTVLEVNRLIYSSYIQMLLPKWAIHSIDQLSEKMEGFVYDLQRSVTVFTHKSEQRTVKFPELDRALQIVVADHVPVPSEEDSYVQI